MEDQHADTFATVAEGEDKQPGAAIFPRDGMPHHRPLGVIDLALFTRSSDDDGVGVRRTGPAHLQHEAADTGVRGGKAVIVDEITVDRHGVAAAGERALDQFAIRFARAGGRCTPRGRRRQRGRDPWRHRPRVGGHRTGRFWRPQSSVPWPPDGNRGGLEVRADGLAPHAGRRLNASERPAEPPKCQNLLPFVVTQDVGHAARDHGPLASSTSWGTATSLAGFQGAP